MALARNTYQTTIACKTTTKEKRRFHLNGHAWPGTRLRSGEKREKTQSNRKNIGERTEPSGSLAEFLFSFFFFAHADFLLLFLLTRPQSSLSCRYSFCLGYARGEDGKASFPSSPSLKSPF